MNYELLSKYYDAGFSLLPVNEIKKPAVDTWGERQKAPVKPNGDFKGYRVKGVAIICGAVSGGLEIIDFDTKNDATGTLMSDYRSLLNDEILLKKLVIQRSPSGGYHFIYRCEEVEGNKKLARRDVLKSENRTEKVVGMIETRGEGGYFLVEPSEGYRIIQGDLFHVPLITIEEREKLQDCGKAFNTHIPAIKDYAERKMERNDADSPFADFNDRFDVVSFLESEGWSVVRSDSSKVQLRRPGKKDGLSATYFIDTKVFYPFTTSSEFEPQQGCKPVRVYATIKCGGDFSTASHEIRQMGYGKKKPQVAQPKIIEITPQKADPNNVFGWDGVHEYIETLRSGTFELGLSTGMRRWNDYFRFKRANLNVINGHDNVGKTIVLIFLLLITAKYYNWKWVVYLAENSKKFFMRKCIEFMCAEKIGGMDKSKIDYWKDFVFDHFYLIDSSLFAAYDEMLSYCEHQRSLRKIDGLLLDPYNSLKPKYQSESAKVSMHSFDYEVMNTFRSYTKSNDCCIYLNCHAVTSALRKVDKDGYLIAPNRADTEGGLKFASKADDFLTVHRLTNHPEDWMITDVHVRKIKEQETGGMPTPKDNPLKLRMMIGGVGFVDEDGWNPLVERQYDPISIAKQEGNRSMDNEYSSGYNPDKTIEPERDEPPF